jgi:uncharacterized membrane protein YgcG
MLSRRSLKLVANGRPTLRHGRGFELVRNYKEFVPFVDLRTAAPGKCGNNVASNCGGGGGSCGGGGKCRFETMGASRSKR